MEDTIKTENKYTKYLPDWDLFCHMLSCPQICLWPQLHFRGVALLRQVAIVMLYEPGAGEK